MASSPKITRKLRIFVVDQDTGRPATGLPIGIFTVEQATDHPPTRATDNPRTLVDHSGVLLAVLQSDHVGYLSFDLNAFPQPKTAMWLAPIHAPNVRRQLTASEIASNLPLLFTLDPQLARSGQARPDTLPSVQAVDETDWRLSPRSFSRLPVEIVGTDGCESMLPSAVPTHHHRFVQTMRKRGEQPVALNPAPLAPCEPTPALGTLCVRRGVVVEYDLVWTPLGHGLGELMYSLPLAPCEGVYLAMIDWSRTDSVERSDAVALDDSLRHAQTRDRVVDDIVDAAASEWQRGGSVMGALSGSYSGGSYSLSGALGAAYTTSAGDRGITANAQQTVVDAIGQATQLQRRLSSTVVVQARQSERDRGESRHVVNHNHAHAMTVLYYEVVRHFQISSRIARARDAIFVIHPEQTFDLPRVRRNAAQLKSALLDQRYANAIDAALRQASAAPAPLVETVRGFVIRITTGDPDAGIEVVGPQARMHFQLITTSGHFQQYYLSDFRTKIAGYTDEGTKDLLYRKDCTNTFIIPALVDGPMPLSELQQVGLHVKREYNQTGWMVTGVDVTAIVSRAGANEFRKLVDRPDLNYFFADDGDWWTNLAQRAPAPQTTVDQALVSSLLTHLQDNAAYYNRVLWWSEHPADRAAWLDRYHYGPANESGRLLDYVENRLVDQVGPWLVLPLISDDDVATLVPNTDERLERIVSVPTRGLFAEAKLSHCSAAEVIDDTRYWQYECEDATPFANLSLGSRARSIDVTPTPLPAGAPGVETAPAAPEPTGLAKVLETIGKSDLFRDMSGKAELKDVMKGLVEGSIDLEKTRLQTEAARDGVGSGGGSTASKPPSGNSGGSTETASASTAPVAAAPGGALAARAFTAQAAAIQSLVGHGINEAEANRLRSQLAQGFVNNVAPPQTTLARIALRLGTTGVAGASIVIWNNSEPRAGTTDASGEVALTVTTSTSWYLLSVALPDVVVPTPPEGSAPTTPNQFSLRVNGHGIAAVQVIVDVGGGRIATFVTDAAGTAVLSAAGHITAVRPNDALLTLTP